MKVKYNQLSISNILLRAPFTIIQVENVLSILEYLHEYADQGGLNLYNDLTFIGDWNSVDDAQAVFKSLLETRLMRRSHIFSQYDGYDLFTSTLITKTKGENIVIDHEYMEESSPIDADLGDITTPNQKKNFTDTHNNTGNNIEDNPNVTINVLEFIRKYPSFYNMIEKIYLSLSEEYTSTY